MTWMRHAGIAAALLLLATSGDGLYSQGAPTQTGTKAIRAALDEGRYTEAERLATDLLGAAARAGDAAATAEASDFLVETLTRNGRIGESRTVALAEGLIADKTALFGANSPEVAASLDNLGALSTARGEFEKAISLHERALGIRRQTVSPTDPGLAETLERLVLPLIWRERFPEAQKHLDEARRIREPSSATAPLAFARTLYLEALLRRWDGRYRSADSALNQVSEIRRALIPNHPENVATLELNGDLLFLTGAARQAEQAWTEALKLAQESLGTGHPAVPPLLHRLAIVAQELGELNRKQELLERAVTAAPAQVPCYAELPAILNDFGTLSKFLGDFQRARSFLDEAFKKSNGCLGAGHSLTTTILYNQAGVASDMGDFIKAETLYRQVIQAWSKRLGPDHPYVARGIDSLAGVASARGRNIEARQLLERALAMRTRALGPESPDVASTLVALARTIVAAGNRAGALEKIDQAIAIYDRGNRPQSPDSVAAAFSERGALMMKQGEYQLGREAFAKALAERERVFGTEHPLTAASRAEVASADYGLGAVDAAVRESLVAEGTGRNHLRFTIRYLPERQALAYADKRPRGLDLALSALADGRVDSRHDVLDAVIRSRGVVVDELGARAHQTAQSADPVLASLNASASAARGRFANLMMRSLKGDDPVPRAILDEARSTKEDAERALAERSALERAELAQANFGLEAVRESLPENSALVAFVRYDRALVPAAGSKAALRTAPSYIGFVLRSDSATVDAVPLGSASALESAVAAWRAQIDGPSTATDLAAAERTYRAAGTQLRRRIWDPFAKRVSGVSQVFVVPDGAVNLVSFTALPTGTHQYLVDDGPVVHYLSAERDVILRDSGAAGRGLLAFGGPAYGDRAQPAGAPAGLRGGCAALGGVHFEDLPGSRIEAAQIAKIWSSSTNDPGSARVLSGRAATETTLKQSAAGHRVVHLATHGYFLQSPCDTRTAGRRGVGGLASHAAPQGFTDNPLLLTGLAFAGANLGASTRTATRGDDGILTGEEVAGLNLQGTEWAVLSACDTGIGQIKAGEGVIGLRRAFQVAGVRTIIMSLWSVEDQSTQLWMRYLYDARFNLQLSTAAAMRAASARVLRERRARQQSTHPFFWAAFVAAGDWR
jgi:CHAT domain-containing protein/tetratricopeptide (TPR) repeat protein